MTAFSVLVLVLLSPVLEAQAIDPYTKLGEPSAAISMPLDRAADARAVYSRILSAGEFTPVEPIPTGNLLIADTTSVVENDSSCSGSVSVSGGLAVGPRAEIQASPERKAGFDELLADYAKHCQDRILLKPSDFGLTMPFRLLDEKEQSRFRATRFRGNGEAVDLVAKAEFAGASGLETLSEVFFNRDHTLAMVHSWQWCGGLCGTSGWIVMERTASGWTRASWGSRFTIS